MEKQGEQNNDRYRHAEKPEKDASTHCLLLKVLCKHNARARSVFHASEEMKVQCLLT
jgi:hypothetical protein